MDSPHRIVRLEEAGQKTASDVFSCLAVGDERAWAGLEWHLDSYSGRLPADTLPIARDSCGNLWLISVGRDNAGSVYFWGHGLFDTFDETDLANWPRIATSFTEFRDNLDAYDATAENNVVSGRYALALGFDDQKYPDLLTPRFGKGLYFALMERGDEFNERDDEQAKLLDFA